MRRENSRPAECVPVASECVCTPLQRPRDQTSENACATVTKSTLSDGSLVSRSLPFTTLPFGNADSDLSACNPHVLRLAPRTRPCSRAAGAALRTFPYRSQRLQLHSQAKSHVPCINPLSAPRRSSGGQQRNCTQVLKNAARCHENALETSHIETIILPHARSGTRVPISRRSGRHKLPFAPQKEYRMSLFAGTNIRTAKNQRTMYAGPLCWHYLFSRPVTRQVSSAELSLTSVFGMGTGGPSPQSTPTIQFDVP